MDRPLHIYKGLSRLLSADSIRHDKPRRQIDGSERLEVIGVTRDSNFGEEGGLKPQASRKPHFTREIAGDLLYYRKVSNLASETPRSQALRSLIKWRKTVARSSPGNDFYSRQL